jgi:hypothetical protein
VFLEPKGFVVLCQLATGISAFYDVYDVSVRQFAALPLASSRPFLAETSLP